ncbi:MAG: DUF4954 family protein [Phycisphaerae bacterium]|nr:DUF4954 family protein [Phycisphaerae bacterium]
MQYRNLTELELEKLQANKCQCNNWTDVQVVDNFDATNICNVHFIGSVKLGQINGTVTLPGNVQQKCGIYDAKIANCTIGNNVYIQNVKTYIANYIINDNAVILDIDLLLTERVSSFGNGVEVSPVNESGGREVPIYDRLSAQIAYLIVLCRHRPLAIANLLAMIKNYTKSVSSEFGTVGHNASIINCGTIKNIKIGDYANLNGVALLENGSINSCSADPAIVGQGVIMRDFIMASGSKVQDNTIVEKCFIGQGTILGKQYSAENSLFFANCGGFHGEACSIFAGPFTVTHHKSTLLIAGMFSFMNAGSGSNQSNHMYKLGPVHQGIVERGSKTTSDSYMLWPAKVGVFTLVMGRHTANSDTTDLPYSYMIESKGESILVPGINLRSVGTVRDARKWPNRDKRRDPDQLDIITYHLLNPYTAGKVLNGLNLLKKLKKNMGETSQAVYYNGVKINRSSLNNGLKFYELALDRYLGNSLVNRLRLIEGWTDQEIREKLQRINDIGRGTWTDIAGQVMPVDCIDQILNRIEKTDKHGLEKTQLEQISGEFRQIFDNYYDYEWVWVLQTAKKFWDITLENCKKTDLSQLVQRWITAVGELDNMRCNDVKKEFAGASRIGYGATDDVLSSRDHDFQSVRGDYEANEVVVDIQTRLKNKQNTALELIEKLNSI